MILRFLYPNLTNKKNIEMMSRIPFEFVNLQALQFTLEEFEHYAQSNSKRKCKDFYEREYWEKHDQNILYAIPYFYLYEQWDNELSKKLAEHLAQNPHLLPYFIQYNAVGIIKELLCLPLYGQESYGTNIDLNERSSFINEYEVTIRRALKSLAIYTSVVEELLVLGVNLRELPFKDFGEIDGKSKHATYESIDKLPNWSESLLKRISREYRRIDGVIFSPDELKKYFSFADIDGFYNTVESLAETLTIMRKIDTKVPNIQNFLNMRRDVTEGIDLATLCQNIRKKIDETNHQSYMNIMNTSLDELLRYVEYYKENGSNDYKKMETLIEKIREALTEKILKMRNVSSMPKNNFQTILEDLYAIVALPSPQSTNFDSKSLVENLQTFLQKATGTGSIGVTEDFTQKPDSTRKIDIHRLERLLPYINDRRKYERLYGAQIRPTIITQDIDAIMRDKISNAELDLAQEDYYAAFGHKQNYNRNSFLEHFAEDKSLFELKLGVQWNDALIEKVATYIKNNPTSLPYFMEYTAICIMGEMLGQNTLFNNIYNRLDIDEKYTWGNSGTSVNDFLWSTTVGKYCLSLFLAVIDRLLDMGLNLAEYRFTYLDRYTTLGQMFDCPPFYHRIITYIDDDGYRREDGLVMSKEELVDIIEFDTLDGFLESVIKLAQIDHLKGYNDRTMLNPKNIMPFTVKKQYFDYRTKTVLDDLYAEAYPDECKIDVVECCNSYRKKLAQRSATTQYELLNRKLTVLRDSVSVARETENFDWTQLNATFDEIYREIQTLPRERQTDLLKSIKELAATGKIEISQPTTLEQRVSNLEKSVQQHDTRLGNLEKKVASLEEAVASIYAYIDKGTPIPQNVAEYLGKKDVVRFITHRTNNKGATLRKAIILGSLVLGSLAVLSSSSVKIDAPEPNFSEKPAISAPVNSDAPIKESLPPIESDKPLPSDKPEEKEQSLLYESIAGSKPYYRSIYDQTPLGTTSQDGFIIRFYLLENGQCVKTLNTEQEVQDFVKEQGENMRNFVWKAAVCSLSRESLAQYVEAGIPIPAEYTTFFTDYTLSLDINFDYNDPHI